jgi:ribosome-associated protein
LVEEKQAADILLLDIREQTALADYFVIATVDNERQASAIQSDMLETLKIEVNIRPLRMEGVDQRGSGWVVLDYGDVIVHLCSRLKCANTTIWKASGKKATSSSRCSREQIDKLWFSEQLF